MTCLAKLMTCVAKLPTRPCSGALLVLLLSLAGCAVNPATGERQLVLFSESQEIQIGEDADQDITASLGIYEDEALETLVSDLGQRMGRASERPDLPWTFRVLDDPTINAFALPGGYIYLTRGILAHLTSEAEVAGILGHEIGHVTARHGIVRLTQAQITQLGLGAAMILAPELQPFGEAVGVGVQLLFLRNSRSAERQADELGIEYMRNLGYDPRELARVFTMLAQASGARDGDRIPGFLSTHPDPLERRDEVLRRVEEAGEDLSDARIGREEYLRLLDGLTFGENPRDGFFREQAFLHPEMAFRVDFPAGWQTVNARTQVQGMSPEQDAAIVLTLVAEDAPGAGRSAFLGQAGMETLRRWDDPVGGLPAAWADFRARTEQGTLQGVVLFVRHGDRTFRILGYGPENTWDRRRGVAHSALLSFQALTDPEVLGIQPRRVEIVQLPRAMTLRTFLQEYPSNARDETVAQINQLELGEEVPSGTLLKRVVGGS